MTELEHEMLPSDPPSVLTLMAAQQTNRANPNQLQVVATDWCRGRKGASLIGTVTLHLPWGILLRECTVHERADKSIWIGLPRRPFVIGGSLARWVHIVDFASREDYKRFQRAAVMAVEKLIVCAEAEAAHA